MSKKKEELSIRHKAFCDEYLINGFNATRAYMKVYPDADYNSANTNGNLLLTRTDISEYIDNERDRMNKKATKTKQDVIEDLIAIVDNFRETGKYTAHTLKAIEILNKMHGWNEPDKIDIKGMNINYIKPNKNNNNE